MLAEALDETRQRETGLTKEKLIMLTGMFIIQERDLERISLMFVNIRASMPMENASFVESFIYAR